MHFVIVAHKSLKLIELVFYRDTKPKSRKGLRQERAGVISRRFRYKNGFGRKPTDPAHLPRRKGLFIPILQLTAPVTQLSRNGLASATAQTRRAPPSISTRVQASSVAPVVSTSSTSPMQPQSGSDPVRQKESRKFSCRWRASSFACWRVLTRRFTSESSTLTPSAAPNHRATQRL